MSFGARARIRLGALQHNFSLLKEAAGGARICSVIKANAFGHGLLAVARGLPQTDSFAVARLSEARVLRDNGIDKPVVLLAGVLTAADLRQALQLDCELVVHNRRQLELFANPPRPIVLDRPCTVGDGIVALDDAAKQRAVQAYQRAAVGPRYE